MRGRALVGVTGRLPETPQAVAISDYFSSGDQVGTLYRCHNRTVVVVVVGSVPRCPNTLDMCEAYDLVIARTHDGKRFCVLCAINETTRKCLTMRVVRWFKCPDCTGSVS